MEKCLELFPLLLTLQYLLEEPYGSLKNYQEALNLQISNGLQIACVMVQLVLFLSAVSRPAFSKWYPSGLEVPDFLPNLEIPGVAISTLQEGSNLNWSLEHGLGQHFSTVATLKCLKLKMLVGEFRELKSKYLLTLLRL